MLSVKPSIMLSRLQKIKTGEDKDFRYGKVLLTKNHWLGQKVTPFEGEGEFLPIERLKIYVVENEEWKEVDVKNIICKSLLKGTICFKFVEESV